MVRDKEFCLICVLHEGIWNDSMRMLRESQRERGGGESLCFSNEYFFIDTFVKERVE